MDLHWQFEYKLISEFKNSNPIGEFVQDAEVTNRLKCMECCLLEPNFGKMKMHSEREELGILHCIGFHTVNDHVSFVLWYSCNKEGRGVPN